MSIILLFSAVLFSQAPKSAPAERSEYFLVESRLVAEDGKPLGALAGLVRREYRPAERLIVESSLSVGLEPGELPTVVTLEWKINGDTAEINDRGGRISGRARLAGPAWAWNAWAWNGKMEKIPGTFRNTAQVTRRGVSIQTEHLDPNGKRLEKFVESQTKITKETYDLLRSKLLPQ